MEKIIISRRQFIIKAYDNKNIKCIFVKYLAFFS